MKKLATINDNIHAMPFRMLKCQLTVHSEHYIYALSVFVDTFSYNSMMTFVFVDFQIKYYFRVRFFSCSIIIHIFDIMFAEIFPRMFPSAEKFIKATYECLRQTHKHTHARTHTHTHTSSSSNAFLERQE